MNNALRNLKSEAPRPGLVRSNPSMQQDLEAPTNCIFRFSYLGSQIGRLSHRCLLDLG
jgi:hypothetical protein